MSMSLTESASVPSRAASSPLHSPPSPPLANCWYRPGSADVLFLVLALVVFQTARQGMLDDPGLGWHLRNSDAMRAEGGWLHIDPFTESRQGQARQWRTNQWLGELPLWLGERWAGLEGIAAVAAVVVALTLRCLYRMLLRDGLPWPVAVFWTALAAMGTSCSWAARPNLFTLLFVLLTTRVCVLFHEGRCSRRFTLWLWPLFAIWANVHGGFVAGLLILGLTLAVEIAQALLSLGAGERPAAAVRARHLTLLLAGACLSTLVNPYGVGLYEWVFQLLGDPYFMELHQEWRSPDFHARGAIRYELLILLFPLMLGVSRRRPSLVELALSVAWLHLALTGFRYVPLWVLVAVPVLARASLEVPWVREVVRRLHGAGQGLASFAPRPGPAPWVWSAATALALFLLARGVEGRFARIQPTMIPTTALDRFLALHAERSARLGHRPVVFHSYDWGGYLTWRGWPACRNWIDDRNEVQGKEHVQDYFAILQTEPGWQDKFDRDGVELVCIQPGAPLAFRLGESPRWQERYRDAFAVIFEQLSPAAQAGD
jgi:hypothetical protein